MSHVPDRASPVTAVGDRIRQLRLGRELTQTELARQIGIQQSDLSRMEKGEYRVSLDVLFRLLHTLGISLVEFFGDQNARALTRTEALLLESFRALSLESQHEVMEFSEFKRRREEENRS
jgi:transcriptional regulator with XRE-family HTH domain